ncbi:hypothetical protein BX264_2494 [Streptomyces sp. 2333.5]|nr:hypothetical protein BX264_2494 [Streptomyces sp. 2333.5]SEC98125.1 hypothetical protein SAMN05428943_2632 [Streptomyces sp. 2314.4]SED84111.1 hypothetical protein SAMN05428942_2596 [Streptomyces sp. 2112.2]
MVHTFGQIAVRGGNFDEVVKRAGPGTDPPSARFVGEFRRLPPDAARGTFQVP